MTHLKTFYSTIANGNMNTNKNFYPEGMSRDEIMDDFTKRRISLGKQEGFNGLKILTPIQKARPVLIGKTEEEKKVLIEKYNSKYSDGHYVRITKEMIDSYNDLYIYSDILMTDYSLPSIALAYPVADCPVVFAEDKKNMVAAMAHCGGEYIDRDLPGQIVDSLYEELDSNPNDIRIYIGPHAQEQSYTYDCFPKFIQNEKRWEECLREVKGIIHINMDKAIIMQLVQRGIQLENISISNIDTITNHEFYSNNRARFDQKRAGRFYEGCFYTDENVKVKGLSR